MKRVVIFASGSGSNAENIINYFENSEKISVVKVYCNKKEAGVYNRCIKLNKDCEWFSREDFSQKNTLLNKLVKETDFIILAGFLWKIPEPIVKAFPNKIINIHPALLPKYGGKGMYGMHVHEAVKNNCDKETGITIHFVNERYDEGAIIFQAKTTLKTTDSSKDIAQKIGKSRSHVANLLRLLTVPLEVQEMIEGRLLSMGHVKVIMNRSDIIKIAQKIITESLSVRQTEVLCSDLTEELFTPEKAKDIKGTKESKEITVDECDGKTQYLTDRLKNILGSNVKIKSQFNPNKNKGKITISYSNLDEITSIIDKYGPISSL